MFLLDERSTTIESELINNISIDVSHINLIY